MDDKIPLRHIYIIHHISPYNCHLIDVPWELKTIDLLFLGVKSIVLSGHVCDIRLCDWLPGMVVSYTSKGYP